MNPKRAAALPKDASRAAFQDAQRLLRNNTASTSIKEATETMTRQLSGVAGAEPPNSPIMLSVQELTQRLVAKVGEAKQQRIENVMRRSTTTVTSTGKKGPTGPFKLDIKVDVGGDDEDELCVLSTDAGDQPTEKSVSPYSGDSRVLSSPAAEHSQGSGRSEKAASPVEEDDAAMLEKLKRKHEIRRMNRSAASEKSVSPDSSRGFGPPPADAPLLPTFPKSPLVTAPPAGFLNPVLSASLLRSATQRLPVVNVPQSDVEKLMRHNSYDNSASKTTVTFTSHKP